MPPPKAAGDEGPDSMQNCLWTLTNTAVQTYVGGVYWGGKRLMIWRFKICEGKVIEYYQWVIFITQDFGELTVKKGLFFFTFFF